MNYQNLLMKVSIIYYYYNLRRNLIIRTIIFMHKYFTAKVDTDKIWIAMVDHKLESIQKYRTNNYASIHTGKIGTSIFKIEEK